ncbi:conserved hypothetical protein [Neospora caninum Liverpool]|uniref:Uncharacterized protein n=1 Tax=Neospora caninum (strain Liverpool) TaxID=572307 RepID=F0VCK9_NEOCL|nr:conserved hypothetical protein [Neospora caninum Liverpool]CBZ51698.1 conserved hypothetical protein [Neospora caninum Liverpool]|eukprot:XP_003881731.1 conserved hypothetical protein [Neospora caninum Liverpool]
MEGPKETAVGEERRRKASESKERKIRGAYPSMASLFQRMREALHLPKYQEVLAAIQADLHKAETNGSGACGDSKEEQDGCGNDGEERERPCEEERQDEQGRDSDAEQRSHIQETEETLEDAKGTAVTPDDAWWWFCANPPSFPFYEVYTEELVNLLATYLHRRICQRIGAVEVVENGHESAGGPSAHNGSEEQEKTLQARSGTAEAPGRQRRRAPSPLRILEVGADEWKEMKQTGVEDYLLIGHAEFGLVGKPSAIMLHNTEAV